MSQNITGILIINLDIRCKTKTTSQVNSFMAISSYPVSIRVIDCCKTIVQLRLGFSMLESGKYLQYRVLNLTDRKDERKTDIGLICLDS